ncbi:MAG: nucleoside triphosphate pyrophosphohydrolase family protein [Dehalococcoidia bacterium]|nr:nucleoside triphosphate pyrophosphohydrolase family protein [Dehalococcoidia bacterium]
MDFNEYQRLSQETDRVPQRGGDGLLLPILGMMGEVASLQTEYKKKLRDGSGHVLFEDHVREELGDVLWYAANLAWKMDLPLEDIAQYNLSKTRARWIESPVTGAARLYDNDYPVTEQLPRQYEAAITEADDPKNKAHLTIEGRSVGDDLDDNSYTEDGYKYHDVFHLAHMTVLGWSPTLRSLMKLKRKTNDQVDNVEDGGRARVIDEAIVAFVFDYARRHNFLKGLRHVDFELLRALRQLTSGLEVGTRAERDWELAIFKGYEVWRAVKENHGGRISGNLETGDFRYLGPL